MTTRTDEGASLPTPAAGEPGLRPLTGSPRGVERLVRSWLAESDAQPLWVRTSGSTGEAKDVALSARALRASAAATFGRLGGPGNWVLAMPADYVAGLQVIVRAVLVDSSPVVLAEHGSLAAATAELPRDRRYLAGVPTQLHRWLGDDTDTAALRQYDAVLVGGSASSTALIDRARQHGVRIVTTYGMTETSGGCVYDGVPLDGVAVAIDADGGVRISGPVLFEGYVDSTERNSHALSDDGWFKTPDLGRFDDDGRLVVIGRRDDVVVSGGVNVPLPAVEESVAAMPGVAGVSVVGCPDAEWGQLVVAVIARSPEVPKPLDLALVRDVVASAHPRAWAPRAVVVVDALPMLDTGKVDRQAVLALAAGR